MDTSKALQAIQKYYDIENPSEDDDFIFTESLKIMITETKDPKYMADLAWYYVSAQYNRVLKTRSIYDP